MELKVLLTIGTVFLSSCVIRPEHRSAPTSGKPSAASGGPEFVKVQAAIFTPYCVSCHVQYGSYSSVKLELMSIASAIQSDRMPKAGGPLPAPLKRELQAWIDKEMLEQGPDALEANWQSIYAHILAPHCIVCHNPMGQAKFLDLSTRQAIFSARDRIYGEPPGKKLLYFEAADQSYIFDVINDDIEPMPPKASNIRRLTPEEIQVLAEWISLGLP